MAAARGAGRVEGGGGPFIQVQTFREALERRERDRREDRAVTSTRWTVQQQGALDQIRRWLDAPRGDRPQVFRLFGYAGTGKSTLAHEINEHVGGAALAAAFTGKAASVMAHKGLPGATTVHRLIYDPVDSGMSMRVLELKDELATLRAAPEADHLSLQRIEALERQLFEVEAESRQPKFVLKELSRVSSAPLVILDECSMVDERMGEDLLSFGTPVLVIGDPAQLPPVRGTGYFTADEPDALLTEVHRQAAGSPIVNLATCVREGRSLPVGEWVTEAGRARVCGRIGADDAVRADQILCGTNSKRRAINYRHRELGGHLDFGPMPAEGERLVCLKNNHDLGLFNGTTWTTTAPSVWAQELDGLTLFVRGDGAEGEGQAVDAEPDVFLDEEEAMRARRWGRANEFTYGYCLTVHKAQGSQWERVVLFDDWPRRSDSRREWLYTGITRAASDLTVVV